MRRLACVVWFVCLFFGCVCLLARAAQSTFDYRVLATNKTSTMEKEMNEAADEHPEERLMRPAIPWKGHSVIVVEVIVVEVT